MRLPSLRPPFALLLALGLSAPGCKEATPSTCQDLCVELVSICEYAAFPSLESCQQGCEYNAEEGADVEGQAACIEAAECDTFAIIECEHEYGLEAGTAESATE